MVVQTRHEHEQPTEEEPRRRGISRRGLLGYGAAAAGAAGLATLGVLLDGGKKTSAPNRTAPDGGQGGEQPEQPETQVDPNNIHHIQETVLADPDLQVAFQKFLGERAPEYVVDDYGRYLYPHLLVNGNTDGALLHIRLIPVNKPQESGPLPEEPVRSWAKLQSAGSTLEWQDFGFGKISYFDGRNGEGAGVQGYTGIGTDQERHFSMSTTDAPGIMAIPTPEERQNSFYNFTSILFKRGALG